MKGSWFTLPMKRITSLLGVTAVAILGGCAVYPDGTPMYGGGYDAGYAGYDGYGYGYGAPPVPQTNVYLGYGNYSGPGYYNRGYGYRDYDRGYDRRRPPPQGQGRPPGNGGGPPPQAGGPDRRGSDRGPRGRGTPPSPPPPRPPGDPAGDC